MVCRYANVLKASGVGKGDRIAIYMPMILKRGVHARLLVPCTPWSSLVLAPVTRPH